jgi:hypothetical protein
MVSIVLLSGLFVGVLTSGVVLADTSRRNLTFRTRCFWIGSVGVVSIGGPLTVYLFDDILYRLYFGLTDGPAVTLLPREVAVAFLVIGLTSGVVAVLAYGFGSRYGPLKVT